MGANLEGHGEFQSKSCVVGAEHWGRTALSTLLIKIFSEHTSLVCLFTDYTSLGTAPRFKRIFLVVFNIIIKLIQSGNLNFYLDFDVCNIQ